MTTLILLFCWAVVACVAAPLIGACIRYGMGGDDDLLPDGCQTLCSDAAGTCLPECPHYRGERS